MQALDGGLLDHLEQSEEQYLERYQFLEKEPHNFFEDGLGINN